MDKNVTKMSDKDYERATEIVNNWKRMHKLEETEKNHIRIFYYCCGYLLGACAMYAVCKIK